MLCVCVCVCVLCVVCVCATEPFIKGEYLSTRDDGIATVKMAWKLADGKPAMAYTHQDNVVAVKTSQPGVQPGSTVGLINSITKSECTAQ